MVGEASPSLEARLASLVYLLASLISLASLASLMASMVASSKASSSYKACPYLLGSQVDRPRWASRPA